MRSSQQYVSADGRRLRLDLVAHSSSVNEIIVHNLSAPSVAVNAMLVMGSIVAAIAITRFIGDFVTNVYLLLFLVGVACYLLYQFVCTVTTETMLVVAPVGVQHTSSFRCGRSISTFIPWYSINDVIIHEVIKFQKVIYILSIIVEDVHCSRKLIPLFPYTRPKLKCLENIYRQTQVLLLSNYQQRDNGGT